MLLATVIVEHYPWARLHTDNIFWPPRPSPPHPPLRDSTTPHASDFAVPVLGRHFLRRSASIQNTAVITAQAPARIRPAPGPPFFATIRVHPKCGRHNCAGARTDTPGIWTGKNIHNPTATKNYVSTKLPRLESATPTATRQYVFADEVPYPHGTDIASTAYDDRRDLAADPFLRRLCDRTPFTRVGPAVRTIRVQVRPP